MTTLKKLNKEFKKQNKLKEYKTMFAHKQMMFATSKVILIFNKDVDVKTLFDIEINLLKENKNPKMFNKAMKQVSKLTNKTINWNVFGTFLWFLFQTSTYYKDVKKGISNIYTDETFIKNNSLKRDAYQTWIDSLNKSDPLYNVRIREVIRELT